MKQLRINNTFINPNHVVFVGLKDEHTVMIRTIDGSDHLINIPDFAIPTEIMQTVLNAWNEALDSAS